METEASDRLEGDERKIHKLLPSEGQIEGRCREREGERRKGKKALGKKNNMGLVTVCF